jgi:hypothetical protein
VLINDFTPTAANEFIIFTFGSLSGGFESINGLNFGDNCSFEYVINEFDSLDGNITLVTHCVEQIAVAAENGQIPEPGMLAIFGLGLAGMGAIRRRRRAA